MKPVQASNSSKGIQAYKKSDYTISHFSASMEGRGLPLRNTTIRKINLPEDFGAIDKRKNESFNDFWSEETTNLFLNKLRESLTMYNLVGFTNKNTLERIQRIINYCFNIHKIDIKISRTGENEILIFKYHI